MPKRFAMTLRGIDMADTKKATQRVAKSAHTMCKLNEMDGDAE